MLLCTDLSIFPGIFEDFEVIMIISYTAPYTICIIFVYVFNFKKTVNNDQNQSHSDCKATTNVMLLYIMTIINIAN